MNQVSTEETKCRVPCYREINRNGEKKKSMERDSNSELNIHILGLRENINWVQYGSAKAGISIPGTHIEARHGRARV